MIRIRHRCGGRETVSGPLRLPFTRWHASPANSKGLLMSRFSTLSALPVLAAGLLAAPAVADVADGPAFQKGDIEVTLGGSGSSDNDFDSNFINFNGSVAYFATDTIALGVRQDLGVADTNNDSSYNAATVVFAQYNIDEFGDFVPFIGATIGYLYGDDVEETFIAGPEIGLKYFVKEDAFFFGRVNYDFLFEDADDADDAFDDGRFTYTIGIGLTF